MNADGDDADDDDNDDIDATVADDAKQMWSLDSDVSLSTVLFPSAVNAILVSGAECSLYAGCQDGNVYRVDYFMDVRAELLGGGATFGSSSLSSSLKQPIPEMFHVAAADEQTLLASSSSLSSSGHGSAQRIYRGPLCSR